MTVAAGVGITEALAPGLGSASAFACALVACAVPFASAQEVSKNEIVEVFAERALMLRLDGTQAITVITRAMIEARQPASAAELLGDVAGVHVDRAGTGGAANVYIRGADPNHTLVLVDGVRVNDPTDVRGGSFDVGSLALDEIESIEVLRGASSSQFGADALGGIVNIVTRRPTRGRRVSLLVSAGGEGFRRGSARVAGGTEAASASAGFERLEDGRLQDGSTVRRDTASATAAWRGSMGELRLHARHAEGESRGFPESSGGVRLAVDRILEARDTRERSGGVRYSAPLSERWRISADLGRADRREDRDSPAVIPGPGGFVPQTRSHTELDRTTFHVQSSWQRLPLDSIAVLGAEYQREQGERDSVTRLGRDIPGSFSLTRETRSPYAHVESHISSDLRLLASVRRDGIEHGPAHTTRSAGARYSITPSQALRAHWSEGVKPPSFFSLGDPLVGNPRLVAEISRNRELGWDVRWQALRLQATLFDSRFANLVDFDPARFQMVNRPGARMDGFEVAAAAQPIEGLQADLAYTHVNARLLGGEETLRNRPRDRASLRLARSWGTWTLRVASTYVGETADFSIPTGSVKLPRYALVDLGLQWRRAGWMLGVHVDNATNRRYESFVGFTAPGARARVSLGVEL